MIIKITKHLDLLPPQSEASEATEGTTTKTPTTTQLPTTQPSNEVKADSNHSSYAAETHPTSDTFELSPTPQTPSSSAADIHINSLILIITAVTMTVITYLQI